MASVLRTPDAQGPLFEDLDVYFSQEECVSLQPTERTFSLPRETTQERFDSMGGEGKTEINQQLSLQSMELEGNLLEKYSIATPLVHYPEKSSEDDIGILEMKISDGTFTSKKKLISLLVTIENQTPLVELSHCFGARTLSEILEVPWEEVKKLYKCPDCDQSFSDNTYLVLHQKIHSREKKYQCDDCGKTFNHNANLRTHRRIHTGEKPYKCSVCATSFRQQSHLSRHMNSHAKEKPYTCSICKRDFMWLPGLIEHQKSHIPKKTYECANNGKIFCPETSLAVSEKTSTSDTPCQYPECAQSFEQSSYPTTPEKGHKDSEHCSTDDENFFSFSRFKPLQCRECDMTFPSFSELVAHQNIHVVEKPYKCKTCEKTFALDSELVCHQKSHTREEPFKCNVCGKSFRVNTHLVTHKRTHRKNTK